ncbi:guanylate kinase [Candidatus Finniella inopinata]|nr:guanylate kinase [Candidatus Finniella inopinata]
MQKNPKRRGLLLVISSPSGVGKTSIVKQLMSLDSELTMSVSATTRPKREGEVDGKDYHFMDEATFQARLQEGAFIEHAKVYGNYYGTPRQFVFDQLDQGLDVVFDIDWQGTQQLAQVARQDLVSIFVLPPSLDELEKRLRGRGLDTQEVIEKRLAQTASELSHWAEYDYVVINDNLEKTVLRVQNILNSERLKRIRQTDLTDFVRGLASQC